MTSIWQVFSLGKSKCLTKPIVMQLPPKPSLFPQFFFWISVVYIKFWTFWKKRCASQLMYLWKHRLQRAWLLKCLKRVAPETHDKFFVIFLDHSERSSVRKIIFLRYLKPGVLFFNILTPYDKYSLSVKVSFSSKQLKICYL